jgi:HD-GYP domain-containing protein (c-di-GMP phosphodiesterase class II)
MASSKKLKLSVYALKPGMFIDDVYNARGILLFSANTLIESARQVDLLKKQGVETVQVNREKSTIDIDTLAPHFYETHTAQRETQKFYSELQHQGSRLYRSTVSSFKTCLSDIKVGRLKNLKMVESTVESITESIFDNFDVLLTLIQIKRFNKTLHFHSVNVCILATALAHSLGYAKRQLTEIAVGSLLHDVGLLRLPQYLLTKAGRFTGREFELYKKHPVYGANFCHDVRDLAPTSCAMIIQHHERINGKGYPDGLENGSIDEAAMICALADVYDSLTSDKTFRPAFSPQEALALIFQGSDEEYPRELVERFTKLLGIYPVGSFVKLDSGAMGIVIRVNRENLLAPTVLVLFDKNNKRLETPAIIDLDNQNKSTEPDRVVRSLDPALYQVEFDSYFGSLIPEISVA